MKLNILSKAEPEDVLRYDYAQIADEEDRSAVMGAAMTIKPLMRRTAEDLVRIGQELIAVKDLLPHGQFTPWIETEFGLHQRTARRMMAVAERLGHKTDTLSDLSASILYELASDTTSDETISRVARLSAAGENLTARDVRGINTLPVTGKAVYWPPAAAQPTTNGVHAEPTVPTQADRSLTVEQTVDMIDLAQGQHPDAPELAVYRGAGWAIFLSERYGFWPTVDVAKRAIAQIMRTTPKPAAYERKVMDDTETQALIARVLDKDFTDDAKRLAFLDNAVPNAYVHAMRPDRYVNSETFEAARAAIRAELVGRMAEAQAQAEKEAKRRQEEARVNAVRHDKETLLYGLRRALAELPEGGEDTYYDLTGVTLYSEARQTLTKAIKELESTMEAKRV